MSIVRIVVIGAAMLFVGMASAQVLSPSIETRLIVGPADGSAVAGWVADTVAGNPIAGVLPNPVTVKVDALWPSPGESLFQITTVSRPGNGRVSLSGLEIEYFNIGGIRPPVIVLGDTTPFVAMGFDYFSEYTPTAVGVSQNGPNLDIRDSGPANAQVEKLVVVSVVPPPPVRFIGDDRTVAVAAIYRDNGDVFSDYAEVKIPVPEPATYAGLFALGLAAFAAFRRFRR